MNEGLVTGEAELPRDHITPAICDILSPGFLLYISHVQERKENQVKSYETPNTNLIYIILN